jgi:hypothetical protein
MQVEATVQYGWIYDRWVVKGTKKIRYRLEKLHVEDDRLKRRY